MNRCLLPENSHLLLYGDLQGEAGLRKEIASYLYQIRGVNCSPEQIIVGAGTYHSLNLLLQLLNEEVTCFGVEEAVNDGVKALFGQFPFEYRPLRLEADGINLEDVYDSGAQAIYVTPSHQFPYGMTLALDKRLSLLKWAKENHAYIIENDYDSEFRYKGRPIPSFQSLDQHERVIYVGTFSKVLTPSFRLSYLVLPNMLLKKFRENKHSYDQLASPIFQKTLQEFMKSGDFELHVQKMRTLYQKKHEALTSAVRRFLHPNVEIIGAGSGLHILLRVQNGMNETELIQSAKTMKINVYPVSVYALEPKYASNSTVLIGFGGFSEKEIEEGIELLGQTWFENKNGE